MAAAEAKAKADGLFRDRKFTDAIDAYGSAIDLDPSNKALYSNRAACQEKLCATLYGDEKKAKILAGLEDARKCVELDEAWARGHQRVATFAALLVKVEVQQVSANEDYVVGPRGGGPGGGLGADREDDDADLRRSASAQARVAALRKECEASCRRGLGLDRSNEFLRAALQDLRDASAFALDGALAPTDADLVDKDAAAAAKKVGSGSFAAKDYKAAAAAFTKALGCVDSNHWFGGSPPNFRTLELGQIKVDSADFWANRLLSSSFRSTAKESGPNRSSTRTLKSG